MRVLLLDGDSPQPKNQEPEYRCATARHFLAWLGFTQPLPGGSRTIMHADEPWITANKKKFAPNVIATHKYNFLTFLPKVLYEQFRFFFNAYFLVVALTQFFEPLKVGFMFTYVAPLVFVLTISMLKEVYDDIQRWKSDKRANSAEYSKLRPNGETVKVPSSELCVGDTIIIHCNERVPADCVLLRTTEKGGACFIRTDQLDGETDWKLRHAIPVCQRCATDEEVVAAKSKIWCEMPKKEIYDFLGTFSSTSSSENETEGLNLENTLWCNTVVATGNCLAAVVYTGCDTRSALNATAAPAKMGKLDIELNFLSKLLCAFMVVMGFFMIAMLKFQGQWYIAWFRFILLFSSIIPISLRVNLDLGKTVYSFFIMRDDTMAGTIVRNSNLPEELGRISFLFSDKTGTLTCNEMHFRRLILTGSIKFTVDQIRELRESIVVQNQKREAELPPFDGSSTDSQPQPRIDFQSMPPIKGLDRAEERVTECIQCIALCHNVTPVVGEGNSMEYQASSPDEVALVKFTEEVGLTLIERDVAEMKLRWPSGRKQPFEILQIFPFTSETKRMGIIVRNVETGLITFYTKGADVVMQQIVKASNWLEEECTNLAREGLRTLVFGMKNLGEEEYENFNERMKQAKVATDQRNEKILATRESLEKGLELVGVTGVEDRLQPDVQQSLEELRNAGIKVWMLTGDKVETATCIARSTRLVDRNHQIYTLQAANTEELEAKLDDFAHEQTKAAGIALVVDGKTLGICLQEMEKRFVEESSKCTSVVICRCSPTQKAEVVAVMKKYNKDIRVAAIGDGGNDVSMIQEAHVGLGIVGKEGKHASMASDFSITQFSHCKRLILWHGRNAYLRSAKLSQFIMHRGFVISILQAVFSAIFYFASIPIFTGWILVGYSTIYTMCPVFALVLDKDVTEENVLLFPELYSELQKGRALSVKTFLTWMWIATYQGGIIMALAIVLFESSFLQIVSITFTALILTELIMVGMEMHKRTMLVFLVAELVSVIAYLLSIIMLPTYFDRHFMLTGEFIWKDIVITVASLIPMIGKYIYRLVKPPVYSKLQSTA
eukprot:TRINITY_DN65800_c6_g3_i1.p1 TRINITY_DN65800_c6_g3~~TRINITY_DN65800_c6_g3_i1.p1  ORF type:complete len:1115 (-),score=98.08 TRINITY_DN65800_c6_g3_i1:221-3409(-)